MLNINACDTNRVNGGGGTMEGGVGEATCSAALFQVSIIIFSFKRISY